MRSLACLLLAAASAIGPDSRGPHRSAIGRAAKGVRKITEQQRDGRRLERRLVLEKR